MADVHVVGVAILAWVSIAECLVRIEDDCPCRYTGFKHDPYRGAVFEYRNIIIGKSFECLVRSR